MKTKLIDFSKEIRAEKVNKKLNKPFRLPKGDRKKFGVYVKNDKGNVVLVKFGDPNMEIKRDDPERRKSFRARHNCDNPGPKFKALFWSCKFWGEKPISELLASEEECGGAESMASLTDFEIDEEDCHCDDCDSKD